MKRIVFWKVCLVILLVWHPSGLYASESTRPNILLIVADDLGYSDIGAFGKGDWELFNLKNDPGEMNDLGTRYPEKREAMIALWEQYKVENGVLDIDMDLSSNKGVK